jgi:hypothetical protein
MYFCAVFKLMGRIDPKCKAFAAETEEEKEEFMFRFVDVCLFVYLFVDPEICQSFEDAI